MTTLSLLISSEEFISLKLRPLFEGRYQQYPNASPGANKWFADGLSKWFKGFADYNESVDHLNGKYCLYAYGDHLNADHKSAATRERLLSVGKYMLFFIQLDVAIQESQTTKSDQLMRQLMDKLVAIVETGRCDDRNFSYGLILLDTINSLDIYMDDYQKSYLRQSLIKTFESRYDFHSNYYLKSLFMPFDDYNKLRVHESGWTMFIRLVEQCMNYSPPDVIRNNDIVVKFYNTVIMMSIAMNDYLTMVKELATNDIKNGILCYAYSHKCTIQSAIDYYYQYIHELDTECLRLMKAAADHQVLSQVIQVANMMQGALNICYYSHAFIYKYYDFKVKNGFIWCQKWDKLYKQFVIVNANFS